MARPSILLFYVFTPLADPEAIRLWQRELCTSLGLRGRIIVSPHGINGTVGGETGAVRRYGRRLREYGPFGEVDLKWSHGTALTEAAGPSGFHECVDFPKLSVKTRPELVTFGVPDEVQVDEGGVVGRGTALTPQELHALLEERGEEVVMFDGRNAREALIGHFEGAVVPDVETTPDFVRQLDAGAFDELKGRPIVTYCTGGVRCEILSSLMRSRGFGEVYQLAGGIVRYGEVYADRGHWKGSVYVFDGREHVEFSAEAQVIGRCHRCGAATHTMETVDVPGRRIQRVTCDGCLAAPAAADEPAAAGTS